MLEFTPEARMALGLGIANPPIPGGRPPYDLTKIPARNGGGSRKVPFDFRWPELPQRTHENVTTCTTIAQLQAAVAISNHTIIIPAGFGTGVGDITITGTDIDIQMDNAAVLQGVAYFSSRDARRIRWTGGTVTGLMDLVNSPGNVTDVLINNVVIDQTTINENNFSTFRERCAWINCTFKAIDDGGAGSGWGIYAGQFALPIGSGRRRDLIIANCLFKPGTTSASTRQCTRFQEVTNLIIVDSAFCLNAIGGNSLRTHGGCENVYFADLVIGESTWGGSKDPGGDPTGYEYGLINSTYERLRRYSTLQVFNTNHDVLNGVMNDSTLVTTTGSLASISPYTGTGNSAESWDGSTYAESEGDFGADH